MDDWTAFPFDAGPYIYDGAALRQHWPRLHRCDAEPWPQDEAVQTAWAAYHAGQFQRAAQIGLGAGAAGLTVANKAQAIYANYLEPREARKLELLTQVARRAAQQTCSEPQNPAAWYWQAYALGRYSQSISVAKALAQGLGMQIKQALETAIRLAPAHADAYVALGAYHAEVIDTMGKIIALTQGADADVGLNLFRRALQINPHSPRARIEYAQGLIMLDGERKQADSDALYREAAACEPADAKERLDVEVAKIEIDGA